jgi:glycosyltransferase involved in cell wall biosynthesis
MMRIRNEERWIQEVLSKTFGAVQTIVVLDDGSDDHTKDECIAACGGLIDMHEDGAIQVYQGKETPAGDRNILHFIKSPFRPAARESQAVSEIRDKNFLWEYCKSKVLFRHMLCLDGDEVPSQAFIRDFSQIIGWLEKQVDVVSIPFIYLWDSNAQRRVDGIYGNLADGYPRLRFPRLFTIDRITADQLHIMRFSWEGSKGGFHCGSIPRENFRPNGVEPTSAVFARPLIHYGYRDDSDRRRKYAFYNQIDPGNKFEGEYKHIIGEPNVHAPGQVALIPWSDQ